MFKTGKADQVAQEMARYKLDILGSRQKIKTKHKAGVNNKTINKILKKVLCRTTNCGT